MNKVWQNCEVNVSVDNLIKLFIVIRDDHFKIEKEKLCRV